MTGIRHRANTKEIELGFGFDAYTSIATAGVFAMIPATSWLMSIVMLGGATAGGKETSFGAVGNVVAGCFFIFAVIVAPWLVPVLVLRARQPNGARIVCDDEEVAEWNGAWKRTAIRWENAIVAKLEWEVTVRSGKRRRVALQVFDKTNPNALITAWEDVPNGAPLVRRRLEAWRLDDLEANLRDKCGPFTGTIDLARVAEPERPVQSTLVRWLTRTGYFTGFLAPLVVVPSPLAGFALAFAASPMLAWRALPSLSEARALARRLRVERPEMPAHADDPYRVAAAPAAPSRDPNEEIALRRKLRAVHLEVFVRGACAIAPIVATVLDYIFMPPA